MRDLERRGGWRWIFSLPIAFGSLIPACQSESKPADSTASQSTKDTQDAAGPNPADASKTASTPKQREALFDEIMAKTQKREAVSGIKNERLGLDIEKDSEALRETVRAADTDEKLFYALVQLSNARRDRHLKVLPAQGGLVVPELDAPPREAPVRFMTDFERTGEYFLFVADYAEDLAGPKPGLGDKVISVFDTPIEQWLSAQDKWLRYSTVDNLWWQRGELLNHERFGMAPPHGNDMLLVQLERREGGQYYEMVLPYTPAKEIKWSGHNRPRYSGFQASLVTESATMYIPLKKQKIVLLDWHGFHPSLLADLGRIMLRAEEKKLLDHDVIVDTTHGRGGAGSASAIRRLSPKRFKGTFGNIRPSDVLAPFIESVKREDWDEPKDHGVLEWLEGEVTKAQAAGDVYSRNVPFKSFHLPPDSDGWFDPAEVHFRGRLACILGPRGGSNLDQFGAMVVDNDLGYTIGLPLGGYSNTWVWTETLTMPETHRPLVTYMWNIGHTIRPNGEILEGNPAVPQERFPVTAENFAGYHDLAIKRIVAHWARTPR